MIKVKNLVKRYGDVIASNSLNCHFEKGKITVILGGSGSGKSTLLRQLTGLEKPDSGSVYFDGLDLTDSSKKQLYDIRKKMGMLFQGSALFNYLNIFENIAFPLREHTKIANNIIKTIVTMKLEMVGLRGTEDLMPSQLSGGMMKRVGLARAIVMDPKVIFYDEPTSGLDPISTGVIDKLIKDLNRALNITSVVVSHDIESCFRIADNIIILFYGDIIAEGTVEEIRNSKDLRVKQFINGEPEGPIPFTRTDKNYLDEILFD
ncbi:MAG: ABC transporter ATP-binding protein [Deltaproteobacteria bacterium]|nr:MAG: ABC transporter ATP-binding protein [Deltaproteobacteria bacterium]